MCKSLKIRTLSILFLFFLASQTSFSQEADLDSGKALFKTLCKQCHNANMKADLTGPALGGIQERWDDEANLYAWIRNSQAFLATGDSYANDLYAEWKQVAMNPFPDLTDVEIANILGYIDGVYQGTYPPRDGGGTDDFVEEVPKSDNTLLYGTLALILGLLSLVLARIIANLNHMQKVKAGQPAPARKTMWEILTSKGVIGFLIFGLILYGGYSSVTGAIELGRSQGYAPEQPIKFSHQTHAGLHKIDCQYCHDGARRSKHSIIPAANTCMNCHEAIKVGSTYGTAELTKIFASIGFDPTDGPTGSYIEDYENMDEAEIEKIYRKWISTNFIATYSDKEGVDLSEDDPKVIRATDEQWNGILAALKTSVDGGEGKIQGPINWVKIHNLPDHVYFNHSQHVTVGEVECQTCHGPVEEMEVLAQYAPLSMGWCVNCHRETDIKFKDNDYYASYKNYHKELKDGKRQGVTVEEIGGVECQKCHY